MPVEEILPPVGDATRGTIMTMPPRNRPQRRNVAPRPLRTLRLLFPAETRELLFGWKDLRLLAIAIMQGIQNGFWVGMFFLVWWVGLRVYWMYRFIKSRLELERMRREIRMQLEDCNWYMAQFLLWKKDQEHKLEVVQELNHHLDSLENHLDKEHEYIQKYTQKYGVSKGDAEWMLAAMYMIQELGNDDWLTEPSGDVKQAADDHGHIVNQTEREGVVSLDHQNFKAAIAKKRLLVTIQIQALEDALGDDINQDDEHESYQDLRARTEKKSHRARSQVQALEDDLGGGINRDDKESGNERSDDDEHLEEGGDELGDDVEHNDGGEQ